jgi:hypothetical protein
MKPLKFKHPIRIDFINQSLEIDETSKSWLRWKIRPQIHFKTEKAWKAFNSRDAGKEAGSIFVGKHGEVYFRVNVDGFRYMAHRIVFALATGTDPGQMEVDHMDRNCLNNSPSNLRAATHLQNSYNRKMNKDNSSGAKGVFWHKQTQKWVAGIGYEKKFRHLGSFANIADAQNAYANASKLFHGEFSGL